MAREEQLAIAAREYVSFHYEGLDNVGYISAYSAFIDGDKWAEKHPINPWHKFTEEFPPKDGTEVLIAMRNKNMMEDGIWLYDVCIFGGGDYTDNNNWEGKVNWERPLYWKYIKEPTAF